MSASSCSYMMNNWFILLYLSQFGEFKVWCAPTGSKSNARTLWQLHVWIYVQKSLGQVVCLLLELDDRICNESVTNWSQVPIIIRVNLKPVWGGRWLRCVIVDTLCNITWWLILKFKTKVVLIYNTYFIWPLTCI